MVHPDSPAHASGLKKKQKIIEVNGCDVKNKLPKEVEILMKQNRTRMDITVVNDDIPITHKPVSQEIKQLPNSNRKKFFFNF